MNYLNITAYKIYVLVRKRNDSFSFMHQNTCLIGKHSYFFFFFFFGGGGGGEGLYIFMSTSLIFDTWKQNAGP